MKKFLSLVLALVMTMSLVTISAGAADFTDNDKVTYDEAVQVISMLGIVNGYEDGSFKPTNTLTRGAAAKIIANLKLTPAVAATLKGSKTTFKDVPESNVFSGYIAYCASEGIIQGYSDGTFKPAGTLNGYAFMKMLLGVLGYDTAIEQYTGSGWEIRVATRANRVGLTDGNDDFAGSKAVTREEACLYAFNALNSEVVEYENKGTNITINGVVIASGASAAAPTVKVEDDSQQGWHYQLYREANFAKLKPVDDATDAFGRPAIKWTYGKKSVTLAAEPDLSYKGIVSTKDLVADLGLKKADGTKTFNYNGSGVPVSKATATDEAAFDSTHMTGTYVYQVSANAYDVFTVTYQYGKVTKVNPASAKNETERNILLSNGKTFDTELFAAKDAVLFAMGEDDEGNEIVADVIAVETVTGTATAKKGDKIVVNGTSYYNTVGVLVNDEGTFTLSFDGAAIIKKDAVGGVESNLYAYVMNTQPAGTVYDENGQPTTGTNVYFVKADGTKAVALLKSNDEVAVSAGHVYNYVLTSKGEFKAIAVVGKATTTTLDKTQIIVDGSSSYFASNTTKYVFVKNSGKYDVTTVTGYTNAKTKAASEIYAVANDDNMALTVFVIGEATGIDSNKQYAFLTDAEATETTVDSKTVYTFSVFGVEGGVLKTTDETVAGEIAAFQKGGRFSYTLLDGYVTAVEAAGANVGTYAAPKTVTNVVEDSGYFVADGQAYVFAKDATVYVYDKDAADADKVFTAATTDSVTIDSKIVIWTNSTTANQADVIVILAD